LICLILTGAIRHLLSIYFAGH